MFHYIKKFICNSKKRRRYINFVIDDAAYRLGLNRSYRPCDISVFVNSICNSNCLMCDIGLKNKNSNFYKLYRRDVNLDVNKFKEFINEVKNFKPSICFAGTEPLLYSPLIELIKIVKDAGLECSMITNGLLLPKMANELCNSGIDCINVSVDGIYELQNRIRRVPNMFNNIVKGLNIILEKRNRPIVNIWTTILPLNYTKLNKTYEFFHELGVDSHFFMHMSWVDEIMCQKHNKIFGSVYPSTKLHASVLNPKKINISILKREIDKLKNKAIFVPEIYDYKTLKKYYHTSEIIKGMDTCKAPFFSVLLAADGTIFTHTRCYYFELGNIYKDSFKTIWNGDKIRQLRKDLLKNKAFPSCARCCGLWSGIWNK